MDCLAVDRVAFSLFGLDVYWYGVIITAAMLLSFFIVLGLCKNKGQPKELAYDMVFFIIPLGIIGARLFSVIFDEGSTIQDFFKFREGGMSIIGAIIGGVIGIIILSLVKKKNFLALSDIVAPVLILSQAIGRWGNFFNQEIYGREVTETAFQTFPFAVYIDAEGGWFEALFFYEFLLNLFGFMLLLILFLKVKPKGIVTSVYLVFYGIVRFFMEDLRQSQFILRINELPVSKLLSGAMVVIGIALFIYSITVHKKNGFKDKDNLNKLTTRGDEYV